MVKNDKGSNGRPGIGGAGGGVIAQNQGAEEERRAGQQRPTTKRWTNGKSMGFRTKVMGTLGATP
jgi:hypothetical protein